MVNSISSPSDPASSLQPPDGEGVKAEERPKMESDGIPVDLAKRFFELQALNDRIKEENQRLGARNLVLEEMCREHRRLLEDKEEHIIRLKEDAVSMSGAEGRLKEMYERLNKKFKGLREVFESEERRWKEEVKKVEEERWMLEVEKRKMEIDLRASRRGADGGGDAVEELKRLLEEKDVAVSELERRNEALEREKMKVEKELGERVVKLEGAVGKWVAGKAEKSFRISPETGMACNVQRKRVEDLRNSVPKSVSISLIQPKEETIEAGVQLKGHDDKTLGSMVPSIGKEVPYAPKSTTSHIVEISDDEEEEEEKRSSSVAFPSTAKHPEYLTVHQKRKSEVVTCPVMKLAEMKRCKYDVFEDGKLWESASKMFNAFTTNGELCMKSVCALYRKQESLGVWKNGSGENNIFRPDAWDIAALGQLLTGGDPEGKMKKLLAEFEREDPIGIDKCRDIARRHHKKLFEIYSNNLDPLFLP